jgi:hypothetical protein
VDGNPLRDGFRGIGRAEDEGRDAIEIGEVGGMIEERTGKNFMGRISLPALKAKLAELRAIREDATLPDDERQAAVAAK